MYKDTGAIGLKQLKEITNNKRRIKELEKQNKELEKEITEELMREYGLERGKIYHSKNYHISVLFTHFATRTSNSFSLYCLENKVTEEEAIKVGQIPFELVGFGKRILKNGDISKRDGDYYTISTFLMEV